MTKSLRTKFYFFAFALYLIFHSIAFGGSQKIKIFITDDEGRTIEDFLYADNSWHNYLYLRDDSDSPLLINTAGLPVPHNDFLPGFTQDNTSLGIIIQIIDANTQVAVDSVLVPPGTTEIERSIDKPGRYVVRAIGVFQKIRIKDFDTDWSSQVTPPALAALGIGQGGRDGYGQYVDLRTEYKIGELDNDWHIDVHRLYTYIIINETVTNVNHNEQDYAYVFLPKSSLERDKGSFKEGAIVYQPIPDEEYNYDLAEDVTVTVVDAIASEILEGYFRTNLPQLINQATKRLLPGAGAALSSGLNIIAMIVRPPEDVLSWRTGYELLASGTCGAICTTIGAAGGGVPGAIALNAAAGFVCEQTLLLPLYVYDEYFLAKIRYRCILSSFDDIEFYVIETKSFNGNTYPKKVRVYNYGDKLISPVLEYVSSGIWNPIDLENPTPEFIGPGEFHDFVISDAGIATATNIYLIDYIDLFLDAISKAHPRNERVNFPIDVRSLISEKFIAPAPPSILNQAKYHFIVYHDDADNQINPYSQLLILKQSPDDSLEIDLRDSGQQTTEGYRILETGDIYLSPGPYDYYFRFIQTQPEVLLEEQKFNHYRAPLPGEEYHMDVVNRPIDVAITSPQANTCITDNTILVEVNNGTTEIQYVNKIEFYANGDLIATDSQAPYNALWDLSNKYLGTNTLSIKAYDVLNRISENSISVFFPVNTLSNGQSAPSAGSTNDTYKFSVIYSSSCNLPPDGNVVQLDIDGISYPMSSSSTNWQSGVTFSYSKSQLSAGTHKYYFTATQNGRTLRFPDSGSRDLIVSQSTTGWDIAILSSGTSYSPQTITSNTNITVNATIKNEGAAGNIYSSVTIKAKLISPSGSQLAEDSEIVSSVEPTISYQRSLTLQMPSQVSNGNHQILISLAFTPDLESDFSDNTYSLYFYVGAAITTEQYAVNLGSITHVKNDVFQINSQSFTLLGVSSDGLIAYIRRPSGDTEEVKKYSLRPFSDENAAIAVQSIIAGSNGNATLQYGPEVTNGPSFVSKEFALLPGNTAYFEVSAPSGKQFATSKDEHEVFRQGNSTAPVNEWLSQIVTSDSDRKAKFYFAVPSSISPGNYVCYLSSRYTTDNPRAHMTRLQITVLAPVPTVERISSTLISADDDLTITGSNFLSSGSVKFNDLTGTVKTWSATSIVVTVPQGVQSGSLMVVTSAGASNSIAYSVKSSTGAPEVLTNIQNQGLKSGEQKFVIDLKQVFSDPNNDPLTFSFQSTQTTLTANTDSLARGRLLLIAAAEASGTAQVTIGAKDPRNRSASTTFDVTITAIPPAPILVSPENQVEQVALFQQLIWRKALTASSYICQLSKMSDFGTISLNLTNLTDTLTTAGSLSPLTTYYWRVAGKNANGTGAFSIIRSFKTKSDLPNQAPLLSWTLETGYTADGLNPDSPDIITPAVLRVQYLDTDNDAPMTGYPKVHVKKGGVEISGSPFVMEAANSDAYSTGRIYQKSLTIATAGTDYSYVFEAQDAEGNTATGEPVTAAKSFTVNNPMPVVSTIDPTQKTINSAEFTLTVNGSNFVSGSVVRFNGSDRTTQFVSSTQLTATILAADLVALGDYPIVVFNPAPGGGTSAENVVLKVNEVSENGPVAYYPFNDKAIDESGNGNHGTLTGNPTPCVDHFGRADKAYYFDGTDDAVVINMSAAMASYSVGPHSYSVWVNRPAGSGDVEFIIDAGGASQDQRGVRYSSLGYPDVKWVISSSSVNTTAATVPSYNEWHHLAGVFTGTEVALYVDGQLASSMPKNGTGDVLSIMKIGNISESANPNQNFTGKIDDVRIYNRALTFQEVLDLYNESAESENHVPELLWTSETGYTADGLNPDSPDIITPAVLRVKYRDADNDAPKDGYPKVHIKKGGVEISGSPFVMEAVNADAYSTGRIYQKSLTIATAGTDYSYIFEAQDAPGSTATGEPVTTAKSFTVNNPLPVVSTIDPAGKTINSEAFTLTVNGSNFINGSVVRFNGLDRTTQFVSSTQLTASILAGDLTTAGSYPIMVFNPSPGGGVSSSSINFTVTSLPSGTIYAHYTFAGNAKDISGNERHGTVFEAIYSSDKSGAAGQALFFDGNNDYVSLPFASQALGSAMTISAWVYRMGSSTGMFVQGIVSNDNKSDRGISIGAYPENGPTPTSANKLQVSVYNDMNTSADLLGVVIPLSQWQYVAMVADGTNLKIYQDGQLQGSKPFSGNLRGSTNFHIGHDQYDEFSERYWDGTIDNVRFYNRALSAAEIADIYTLESGSGAVNHPPVVTTLLPNSGSFKDPVSISATYSDPDAGDQVVSVKYEYNLGGTDWVAVGEDATPGNPLDWTSGLNVNNVNLRAKAFDGELWSTEWFVTTGSFTVDNTPPQFSGWKTEPADLSTLTTGPLLVSVRIGDDFSGFGANIPQLDYHLTGAFYDGYESMTQLDAATWTFDIPEPAGGWSAQGGKTLYFKTQAADELGNSAESAEQMRPIYTGQVPPLVHYDFDQNCLNKGIGGSGWNLVNHGAAYDGSELRLGTAAARLTQSAAIQQNFKSANVTTELGEPFTISGWFRWDGSPFLQTSGHPPQVSQQIVGALMGQGDYPGDIACEGNGSRHWALSLDTQNSKLGFVINSAGCGGEWQQSWSGSGSITANQWTWFCLSYDGSGALSLYLNDDLAASRTDHVSGGSGEFNTGLYVGSGYYYYYSSNYPDYEVTSYFPGHLDDIRIYRRELTSEERSALYHEGGWPPNRTPVVTQLSPATGVYNNPVQLSAVYSDADGDAISSIQYQYTLTDGGSWTDIVEDTSPADGYAWDSHIYSTTVFMRARAYDGKGWGEWYANPTTFTIADPAIPWTFAETGKNASIAILTSINPAIDGQPLQAGDVIGVFYLRDGALVCGGYEIWTGTSNIAITANGDDDLTTIKDGFAENELFQFKIWDASADKQYSATVSYEIGGPNYVTNGINVLASLTGQISVTQMVSLPSGWGMLSSYVIPVDSRLEVLFAGLDERLTILKNTNGKVYWPEMEINAIGDWNYRMGYQIFMKSAGTLSVTGQAVVPESCPISLIQGWNLIAYLRSSNMGIAAALTTISSDIMIIKNGSGKVYWPEFEIDAIGDMKVGEGYHIYMKQAGTLTYPANSLAKEGGALGSMAWVAKHYPAVNVSSASTAVIGIRGELLEEGDEVSAWNRHGHLLAAGAVHNGHTVLTVAGDDPATQEIHEGLAEGEAIWLKLWRHSDGVEIAADSWQVEDALTGMPLGSELAYHSEAVYLVEAGSVETALASSYRLEQNYPNPFNPETAIRFSIPRGERVRLMVMNLQGQEMRVLMDEQCAAGTHSVIWDGCDDSGQPVASGVYMIRMQAGEYRHSVKISFIK